MTAYQSLLLLALAASASAAMEASDTMGPASLWWPPDRPWSEETDNTAPCGSSAGVANRTAFPLTGARIAFTAQDDSYNAQLSISFLNGNQFYPHLLSTLSPPLHHHKQLTLTLTFQKDPQSNDDFAPLSTSAIPEIDPGHTCLSVPDQRSSIAPGTNATIQVKYTADFDRPENQTFYACADVTFVAESAFNHADIPCFNATSDEDVPAPTATGTPTNLPGHGESGPPLNTPGPSVEPVAGGGGGLSAGGIAGAVVGSVVGVALIVGLGLLFYRERERKKRLVEERDAGRAVKWVDGSASASSQRGNDSVSAESIRMGNMPAQP
ncbi:hypothetical protein N658DRAFT_161244 [Parathielavia hyrcaniae]|uniref:Copper acquisition factor BIM1-like domain-containing protein n=1 Tax=Parathielavia hyrcaniae TaxID=113614 RepID=A0AAN6SZI9_9PEZI|nr:hypothetical protein N658DRAFT_161244 [Parathielavia hyrcaniae]